MMWRTATHPLSLHCMRHPPTRFTSHAHTPYTTPRHDTLGSCAASSIPAHKPRQPPSLKSHHTLRCTLPAAAHEADPACPASGRQTWRVAVATPAGVQQPASSNRTDNCCSQTVQQTFPVHSCTDKHTCWSFSCSSRLCCDAASSAVFCAAASCPCSSARRPSNTCTCVLACSCRTNEGVHQQRNT